MQSGFPRTEWLRQDATVLCFCQMARHGLRASGRRNRLCTLFGPYNDAMLNPCHPAMLAALRGCNVDVQLPYRLPFTCPECKAKFSTKELGKLMFAMQRAQDAQTGYCCDYCSKSQPMAFHEVREFQKGHMALHQDLSTKQNTLQTHGQRHTLRLLTDAYCKGIVRGQVECANLRANHKEDQVVHAERFSTTHYCDMNGRAFVDLLNRLNHANSADPAAVPLRPSRGQNMNLARAYGLRPNNEQIWYLSAYEFNMKWQLRALAVPKTLDEWNDPCAKVWHISLTDAGLHQLTAATPEKRAHLTPYKHYRVKPWSSDAVCFFEDGNPSTRTLRHGWYLERRPRPLCPHFANSPVPKRLQEDTERNALLVQAYFRPWTLHAKRPCDTVPHATKLRQASESWDASLRAWLRKLPSQETKRHVGNFLSVYRVRPNEEEGANSDNSDVDETLNLTSSSAARALQTQLSQQHKKRKLHGTEGTDEAISLAEKAWPRLSATSTPTASQNVQVDVKRVVRASRKRSQPAPDFDRACWTARDGSVQQEDFQKALPDVDAWLAQLSTPNQHTGATRHNERQLAFLQRVATQVKNDLCTEHVDETCARARRPPLRWALHGGPGTGKSYTLRALRAELFEEILGWKPDVQFKFLTFQAVVANQLDGDTIHHGVGLHGRNSDASMGSARMTELKLKGVLWRWLVLDEISMVSAELISRLEMRCREIGRRHDVPWGGLNVILAGDVWQLEPPRGTFIANLPLQWLTHGATSKRPPAATGQALIWDTNAEHGIQGVTELVEVKRTDDAWLQHVQDQIRHGELSATNHAFMHGKPTKVAGSWMKGQVLCKNQACQRLSDGFCTEKEVAEEECPRCRSERSSRALVLTGETDPRLRGALEKAVCIFATNAAKYHTNKLRAHTHAVQHQQPLYYSVAEDRASAAALAEMQDLQNRKDEWLQRHDRECGTCMACFRSVWACQCERPTTSIAKGPSCAARAAKFCAGHCQTIALLPWPWKEEGTHGASSQNWCGSNSRRLRHGLSTRSWEKTSTPCSHHEVNGSWTQVGWHRSSPSRGANSSSPGVRHHGPRGPGPKSVGGHRRLRRGQVDLLHRHRTRAVSGGPGHLSPLPAGAVQAAANAGTQPPASSLAGGAHRLGQVQGRAPARTSLLGVRRAEASKGLRHGSVATRRQCPSLQGVSPEPRGRGDALAVRQLQDLGCRRRLPGRKAKESSEHFCADLSQLQPPQAVQPVQAHTDGGSLQRRGVEASRNGPIDLLRLRQGAATGVDVQCSQKKPRPAFTRHVRTVTHGRFRKNASCNACLLRQDTAERGASAKNRLRRLRKRTQSQYPATKRPRTARRGTHASAQTTKNTSERRTQVYVYTCPWCRQDVRSAIHTGKVDHRSACGKQFRVCNGLVGGWTHPHSCPKCGAVVFAAKPSGKVQCIHKRPDGRTCAQQSWYAPEAHDATTTHKRKP